jgi:fermentation-respiration switch protein FrsA (DUF1100 family)
MLDLHIPWQPPVRQHRENPLWRGLAMVLRSAMPYTLDPSPALLVPATDAAHTTERVSIPIGDHVTPGYLFEPKQASGATVVIAHGTTAEKTLPYYFWIVSLLGAGIRVLTFELDGHGDNPRALACPGLDENLPAALAYLRARPGIDPNRVGLLGVSLGGACVLNTAPKDSGVKAVVTVSTPYRVNLDEWNKLSEALGTFNPEVLPVLASATPNKLMEFFTTPMRVAAGNEQPPEVMDFLDPRTADAVNRALRYLNPLDNVGRLHTTPTLVINGEWDNIAPPWQALELYERATGPKALAMVPRRNHLTIMLSRQAVDAMTHWFRRWL